jgi:Xaa-Pro aminopeptidase
VLAARDGDTGRPEPRMPMLVERHRKTAAVARTVGADVIVASDPATVYWLTGLEQEYEWGPPYPFSAGAVAVVDADARAHLLVSADAEVPPSAAGIVVKRFEPLSPMNDSPTAMLAARFAELGLGNVRLAIEAHAVPSQLTKGLDWVNVSAALRDVRAVKDEDEIAAIRCACEVAAVGQRTFREVARPGLREIDVYSEIRTRVQSFAGTRVPMLPDLLSGDRIREVGKPPTDRQMGSDELVLCDLIVRAGGAWSDSCSTIFLGEPTAELRRVHDACRRALDAAIAMARPGVTAGAIDLLCRQKIAGVGFAYPHH